MIIGIGRRWRIIGSSTRGTFGRIISRARVSCIWSMGRGLRGSFMMIRSMGRECSIGMGVVLGAGGSRISLLGFFDLILINLCLFIECVSIVETVLLKS